MRIHIICIGNELLTGYTLNTNLAFVGQRLFEAGYAVSREVCVPDERDAIASTVRQESAVADLVITIGGLGPTSDDVTRPTVAETLGMPLELRKDVLDHIQAYLNRRHVKVPSEALRVQAMAPRGAAVLLNHNGTAPGLWCERGGRVVVMLPGPPRELHPMFLQQVLPRILDRWPPQVRCRTVHVCGVPESVTAETVEPLLERFPGVAPAYCARPSEVVVRLTASADVEDVLDRATAAVRAALGKAVLPEDAGSLAEAVGVELSARGWTLATAESCTGGGVGAAITDVPGASRYYVGGVVAYSNALKQALLGVRGQTLEEHGAVSAGTAREMAEGVAARCEADTAVAVTGVAGPTGGTPEKPVGLVYIATYVRGDTRVYERRFPGDRNTVRMRTVTVALDLLRRHIVG